MEMQFSDLRPTAGGALRDRLVIAARRSGKEPDREAGGQPQIRRTSVPRATFQPVPQRIGRVDGAAAQVLEIQSVGHDSPIDENKIVKWLTRAHTCVCVYLPRDLSFSLSTSRHLFGEGLRSRDGVEMGVRPEQRSHARPAMSGEEVRRWFYPHRRFGGPAPPHSVASKKNTG